MEPIAEDRSTVSDHSSFKTPSKESLGDRQSSSGNSSVAQFKFPAPTSDVSSCLSPLRDNHSAYASVARSCLQLTHYAGNGSSEAARDAHEHAVVASSSLFHDASYSAVMTAAFAALIETLQTHDDRRAKIIAARTLSILGRSAYARLRHSPHLFVQRDAIVSRLEDEVGSDVSMALCTAALEDHDDGVAASAFASLGSLVMSSLGRPGTLVDDQLQRELLSLARGRPASSYGPTLDALQDEDPLTPQIELQNRVYDNVVSPRLMQLVCRFTEMESTHHIRQILPFLTSSLIHLIKTAPPILHGLDRATFSKRWIELDHVGLVNNVVEVLMLPAVQLELDGQLATSAAMETIRLVNACPHASWAPEMCRWSAVALQEEYTASYTDSSVETKLTLLASLVVCSRAIPLPERSSILDFIFEKLQTIPSTTPVPFGVASAGLLLEVRGFRQYRNPARSAFLAEIALSYFLDGPVLAVDAKQTARARSNSLKTFLSSGSIVSLIKEQKPNGVFQLREELVHAFCTVAIHANRRDWEDDESTRTFVSNQSDREEWARMSLIILTAFSSCVGWGSPPVFMEEEMSMLASAQASYASLAQEVVFSVGLLNQASVSLRLYPAIMPSSFIWDRVEESAEQLASIESNMRIIESVISPVSTVMDDLVKKELKNQGIISHHMRLIILCLAADQWVEHQHTTIQKEGGKTITKEHINSAKDMLTALSPRRFIDKIVESSKRQIEQYGKKKKEMYKQYAQDAMTVCVACIENIALVACALHKLQGSESNAKQIINLAVASLQGKTTDDDDDDDDQPVVPVCHGAIERIQEAFSNSAPLSIETLPLSMLLVRAGESKPRPKLSAARPHLGQAQYEEAYMVQLSRQIIASRADQCVLSSPLLHTDGGSARHQNRLRLAIPPLPASRNPRNPLDSVSKFDWGSNVINVSGGSDAAAVVLSYSMRRSLRYDGEDEFRLVVAMRVQNTIGVEIEKGLRLELSVVQKQVPIDEPIVDDTTSMEVVTSLGVESGALNESSIAAVSTLYKQELKPGEYLTWEIELGPLPMEGSISLHPSVVYQLVPMEPKNACWIGDDAKEAKGDASVVSAMSQYSGTETESGGDDERIENVHITCEPVRLSPLIGLQPCPLVFYKDGCGDVDCFRFLWSRMPCQIPPLRVSLHLSPSSNLFSSDARRLASMSILRFTGEVVPDGSITKIWAFMASNGKRVLCVMAESNVKTVEEKTNDKTFHVRGDCKALLLSLSGTAASRNALVEALAPGFQPI